MPSIRYVKWDIQAYRQTDRRRSKKKSPPAPKNCGRAARLAEELKSEKTVLGRTATGSLAGADEAGLQGRNRRPLPQVGSIDAFAAAQQRRLTATHGQGRRGYLLYVRWPGPLRSVRMRNLRTAQVS